MVTEIGFCGRAIFLLEEFLKLPLLLGRLPFGGRLATLGSLGAAGFSALP